MSNMAPEALQRLKTLVEHNTLSSLFILITIQTFTCTRHGHECHGLFALQVTVEQTPLRTIKTRTGPHTCIYSI